MSSFQTGWRASTANWYRPGAKPYTWSQNNFTDGTGFKQSRWIFRSLRYLTRWWRIYLWSVSSFLEYWSYFYLRFSLILTFQMLIHTYAHTCICIYTHICLSLNIKWVYLIYVKIIIFATMYFPGCLSPGWNNYFFSFQITTFIY